MRLGRSGADNDEIGAGGFDLIFNEAVDAAGEGENEDDAGDADGDAETSEKGASAIAAEGIKSQFVMGAEQDWHYFFPFFLVDFLDFGADFFSFSGFSSFSVVEFLTMRTETGWGRSASSTVLISVSIWPSSMRMTRVA